MDLNTIFLDTTGGHSDRLDLIEERLLLEAAQQGDRTASERLIMAYATAIRAAVANYIRATDEYPQPADLEDLQGQAVMGVMEAIQAFDPNRHERLAATVATYIQHAIADVSAGGAAFSIPARTLSRFFGILRAAGGDVVEGARIAPDHKMRRETFEAVLDSVRRTGSYEGEQEFNNDGHGDLGSDRDLQAYPLWDNAQPDVEDRILVEAAFEAVDTLEKDVVSLAYGFSDYDPVSDAEIADRIGMSRAKIQRTRSGALTKMRLAVGVA